MNSPRPEDLERLRGSRRPRIAFVSHGFGGGVGRHIEELAASLEADAEILLVEPFRKSFVALRWLRSGEDLALWFRKDEEWEALLSVLAGIGIDRLHYHHVHGMPRAVLDLPARLGVPHDVTLHDYFAACPNYHLTGPDGRFCGGGPQCLRCVEAGPAQWPMSIEAWRASFGKWLEAAQRVIAPSQDSARRLGEFFPDARFVVWPHPQASLSSPTTLRVLVPGAISPEKGLDLLEACVDDAARRKLPLHFRVLGYTARPIEPWPRKPYSVSGEFPEGRLAELLALERGDVLFFPAQCPETFSYTLSAGLDTALPIVATDLGALPERLAHRANARIVPWSSSASEVNDLLVALASPQRASPGSASPMTFERYRELYSATLPAIARPAGATMPRLEPQWLSEPSEALSSWTLAALFDDAIGCGRASSLELLRRKVREADAELEAARARPAPGEEPSRAAQELSADEVEDKAPSALAAPFRAFARLLRR